MIYDPVGNQLVAFGGTNGTYQNDTWKLSLGVTPTWALVTPTSGSPAARSGQAMDYDSTNKLIWMFGGTYTGADFNDVWKFNIATNTWTQVFADGCTTSCPTRRDGGKWVYDSVNKQMVLFGGYDSAHTTYLNSVDILTNLDTTPTWSAATPDSAVPVPRYYHTAVYDPQNQRMVIFAGLKNTAGVIKDLSALYLPSGGAATFWRGIAANNVMNARDQSAVYYDPVNKYMYAFGGYGNGSLPGVNDFGIHIAETFRLDVPNGRVPRWRNVSSQYQAGGAAPLEREAPSFAADSTNKKLYVFGGLYVDSNLNDTWVADMSDGTKEPVWTQLCSPTSCGTAPPVRWGGVAVYDSVDNTFVIFGGHESTGNTDYNDVWSLSLGANPTWTQLTPSGTAPSARWAGAAVYDQPNNRMVIFGGQKGTDSVPTDYNDVWSLSLGASPAWTQLTPTGTAPAVRRSMAYALSTTGGTKLISFGGYNAGSLTHYNDLDVLDLSTTNGAWSTPFPNDCASITAPTCRRSSSGVYDPVGNRFIVVNGRIAAQLYNDAYSFDLTGNTWTNLNPQNEIHMSVPVSGLSDGAYHWQYRVLGSSSGAGGFISYGQNVDTIRADTDFMSCGLPTIDKRLRQGTYFCGQVKQYNYLP